MTDYFKRCSKCEKWWTSEDYYSSRTDRDGLSAWCKHCFREYHKRYQQKNKAVIAYKSRKRRRSVEGYIASRSYIHRKKAAEYGVECTLTDEDWEKLLLQSNGFCYYCGKPHQLRELTIDHVIPMSKGGGHTRDNVVMACIKCNASKGEDSAWPKYLQSELEQKV